MDGVYKEPTPIDSDIDLFFEFTNRALKTMTFMQIDGEMQVGQLLSRQEFDQCVSAYERKGEKFW